jgi:hypothetical protein
MGLFGAFRLESQGAEKNEMERTERKSESISERDINFY